MWIANRYALENELGAGGMGTVYRGLDTHNQQTLAIKRLKPEISSIDLIERFKREGEALRELNHPNIVKMLDNVEHEGEHYLIMEYVSGGDLAHLLTTETLSIEHCLKLALDLADALTRAHKLNIIHRDLKPANVLLAEDGTLRLTDFGVAYIGQKARVTDSGIMVGTVDYMPPEMLNGEEIDARADIWAFGVMLFEMLTGQRPFSSETVTHTLYAIATEPVPDLEELRPDAPIPLLDLIYRMLEKDRNARIRSVRHVGAELEDILYGRKLQKQPDTRFDTPVPDTFERPKHNLPLQSTPFVGRERELDEVAKMLDDPKIRLVTILAPGGMGKTRLALEAAERHLTPPQPLPEASRRGFTDGVYFVELAPLSDPENIIPAIAEATSFQFQADERSQKQQILDFLRTKKMLLVLDNFEHLLDGAGIVTDILKVTPDVQILATSRQRLNQAGETLLHLSGMDFPKWETPEDALEYAAVKLFMNSALRAQPHFELTKDNLDYVARICRLVQGMPLGIVLAAAWLAMLSPEEIADELQQSMDILQNEAGEVPERQQSIRAVFDYSWQTMDADEQSIFMKMSIFRGGFSRNAAQTITGANLKQLMSLVNKSLIRRDNDSGRYEIHELLRQYAEEKLAQIADVEAVRDAHSDYYLTTLHTRYTDLIGAKGIEFLDAIEMDFENVRAALLWAGEMANYTTIQNGLRTLAFYFNLRTQLDVGSKLLEQLIQLIEKHVDTTEQQNIIDYLRLHQAIIALGKENLEATEKHFQQVPDLSNSGIASPARALYVELQAIITHQKESGQAAVPLFEQARNLYLQVGNIVSADVMLVNIANGYWHNNSEPDWQTAKEHMLHAYEHFKKQGDVVVMGWIAMNVANVINGISQSIDFELAESYYIEAIKYAHRAGNLILASNTWRNMGVTSLISGKLEAARNHITEAIKIVDTTGHHSRMMAYRIDMANIELSLGNFEQSEAWFQNALAISRDATGLTDQLRWLYIDYSYLMIHTGQIDEALKHAKMALEFSQRFNIQSEILQSHLLTGRVYLELGEWDTASKYFETALRAAQNEDHAFGQHFIAISQAALAYRIGETQAAINYAQNSVDYFRDARTSGPSKRLLSSALSLLSRSLAAQEDVNEAKKAAIESLSVAQETGAIYVQGGALLVFALWFEATGQDEEAVELAAYIEGEKRFAHYDKQDATHLLEKLAPKLSDTDYQQAVKTGQATDLDTVINQLLETYSSDNA